MARFFPCRHKTFKDHVAALEEDGRRIFKCSFCGKFGTWEKTWSYWGTTECTTCGTARVDTVSCGCMAPTPARVLNAEAMGTP